MSYTPFGPPAAWSEAFARAATSHGELLDRSDSWSTWLKAKLDTIAEEVTTPDFTVSWGTITGAVPVTWGAAYSAPTLPSLSEAPTGPDAPTIGTIPTVTAPTIGTAPVWDATLPDTPGDAPSPTILTVAELAALSLPTFSVTVPSETIAALTAAFSFTPGTYTPTLKTAAANVIDSVLDGNPVISAEVFLDIFTAASDDLTTIYAGDMLQAGNTVGMLGELPSEALLVRVDLATAKHRQELQKVRITTAIEQAKAWRDDFWKGVDAAQAFEQLWSGFFLNEEANRLKAAAATVEAAVSVYNANVARWNAMLAMASTHVAVSAEQRARAMMVIEDHRERLQQRQSDIAAADLAVKLWLGQWDGYAKAAGAETQVFAGKVQAFSASLEGSKTTLSASVETAKAAIEKEVAITQRFSETWKGIATKTQAVLQQMQAAGVPAELQIKSEEARMRNDAQVLQLALSNAQNELTKGVETAKLRLQQVQYAAQQGLEVQKTIATLMAHTMGAYLASGSINYGASASAGYSTDNSWSYKAPE